MKKKLVIGAVFLTILCIAGYWQFDQLGGNNPIEISLVEKNPAPLTGITYIGTPQDKKLSESFRTMEDQKKLHPGTYLHTIYEVEPAGKLDTMKVFVGINHPLSGEKFENRVFTESSFLQAKITGNKWVMPGPDKVKSRITEYAKENKLELSGIFIDKIVSENEVHVTAPVR